MSDEQYRSFLNILDDAADLLRDGFRRERISYDQIGFKALRGEGGDVDPSDAVTVHGSYNHESASTAGPAESQLAAIAAEVSSCERCELCRGRTNAVPGAGVATPKVVVIGEGPGAEEDRSGQPFVGTAGRYLDKWLTSIGLSRDANCYITNIVKCRPPNNRDPKPEESAECIHYLERQVDRLKPAVILTVGRIAVQNLLSLQRGIGSLRGSTYQYRGIPVIPTYHPSGVLRNPEYRSDVWDDLKRLKKLLEDE